MACSKYKATFTIALIPTEAEKTNFQVTKNQITSQYCLELAYSVRLNKCTNKTEYYLLYTFVYCEAISSTIGLMFSSSRFCWKSARKLLC